MTAAVIALALVAAGLGAALVLVTRWGMRAKDDAGDLAYRLSEQIRVSGDALRIALDQRNDLRAKYDVSQQALAATKTRLAIAETQRNRAYLEERERVVQTIRNADPAGASDLVNRILQTGVVLPKAGTPSPGDGDR